MSYIIGILIILVSSVGIFLGVVKNQNIAEEDIPVVTSPVKLEAIDDIKGDITKIETTEVEKPVIMPKVVIPVVPVPVKTTPKTEPKSEVKPEPKQAPIATPEPVAVFRIGEITKNIKRETDYSGQDRKIISLDIVVENPKLVFKEGEWHMDLYLSADTSAEDGSKPGFLNGENISRVSVSSPYKLKFATFVLSENLQADITGIYTSKFRVRDANSGMETERSIVINLNF